MVTPQEGNFARPGGHAHPGYLPSVGLYVARASGYVSRREMPQGSIGGTLLRVGVVERRSEEQSPRLEALPRSLP